LSLCGLSAGGFGGNTGHDPHITYTLYAVQVLALCDRLADPRFQKERVIQYVRERQEEDGSFTGDEWGEVDTRFSYCGLACLTILGRAEAADRIKAVQFIKRCQNFDGGFGCVPGAETHAGQIFTCVGALAVVDALDQVDTDLLGWWLAERQTPGGGLNGRPEKLPDVCYSWWVLSSLACLRRLQWIDGAKLKHFIMQAQDPDDGGIADRPDDAADLFHTFFGIAGLALLREPGLAPVDPVFALPIAVTKRLGIYRGDAVEW